MRALVAPWGQAAWGGAAPLHPDEEAFAAGLAAARAAEWRAGRAALRALIVAHGVLDAPPILATPRGAPRLPPGLVGSLSHKDGAIVAVVGPADGWHLGVDLELDAPPRGDLASRVLTEVERGVLDGLHEDARGRAVRRAFAVKEAIYKAIDPWVGRYVGFREIELRFRDATVEVRALAADLAPLTIEARLDGDGAHLVAWARARR